MLWKGNFRCLFSEEVIRSVSIRRWMIDLSAPHVKSLRRFWLLWPFSSANLSDVIVLEWSSIIAIFSYLLSLSSKI